MAKILELQSKESQDEMLDVMEWDGSAWQAVWEQFIIPAAAATGQTPWDVLANFVRGLLSIEK